MSVAFCSKQRRSQAHTQLAKNHLRNSCYHYDSFLHAGQSTLHRIKAAVEVP